jgi:hypothetical protein
LNFASFETFHPYVIISSTETFFAKLVQVWRMPKKLRHFRDLQKAFGIP